ncbi:MAG TPA: RNA polymerase sigma factor FliA [Gammaproteobacteria bacterium]|nr:RNA polymerase sigma factor FliA [Gammaproteobacteria bacterium]
MYASDALGDNEILVERYMDLVRRIAHHLLGRLPAAVQVQDLIQAGAMALLEAARQYNESRGASFETYAGIRIRGAMLDEVRRLDWAPRSANRTLRQIGDALRAVELRAGRAASAAEAAAELGVDLETYHDMLRKATEARIFSIEELVGPGEDAAESIPGDGADPAVECVRDGLREAVAAAIAALPEREQQVLSLYYDEELNLREIGEVLGVSESRVCQIHGQALARLRASLAEWSRGETAS